MGPRSYAAWGTAPQGAVFAHPECGMLGASVQGRADRETPVAGYRRRPWSRRSLRLDVAGSATRDKANDRGRFSPPDPTAASDSARPGSNPQ